MLQLLFLMAAMAAPPGADNSSTPTPLGDPDIVVQRVQLPVEGFDPHNITLVLTENVKGCKKPGAPRIERNGQHIRIMPQAEQGGRAPCAESRPTTQIVELGPLVRGSYRVQVLTAKSQIFKILNVY